ncbi:MAG: J domain-containing protein [Acidimicrobiia bacterium]|nr:J domain-containing protein [Acidimicrobiia bacterium]
MSEARAATHYDLFGVDPECSFEEIRSAYRRLARQRHPDVVGFGAASADMAEINEAWRVLSDSARRRSYDATVSRPVRAPVATPQPAPTTQRSRRRAWAAGVQGQIAKLSRLAGRSATQTLLIRQPRAPRAEYERLVGILVHGLCEDTESRVRAARAAGAAPLDLAVGATLIGIRTLADRLRRDGPLGLTDDVIMSAELLDRMWDVLAHELPVQLATALGGNPHVARVLLGKRAQRSTG